MSVSEILAELPQLAPDELNLVLERMLELQQNRGVEVSPELLQAIAEADAAPESEDISIDEALRIVRSWNTK